MKGLMICSYRCLGGYGAKRAFELLLVLYCDLACLMISSWHSLPLKPDNLIPSLHSSSSWSDGVAHHLSQGTRICIGLSTLPLLVLNFNFNEVTSMDLYSSHDLNEWIKKSGNVQPKYMRSLSSALQGNYHSFTHLSLVWYHSRKMSLKQWSMSTMHQDQYGDSGVCFFHFLKYFL